MKFCRTAFALFYFAKERTMNIPQPSAISLKNSRRDFWQRYARLLLTLAGQNIIVYGVNLLDNIMIGKYSELALSGVFIVNQIQFLLQMIVGGISDGTIVIASRFWGEKDTAKIKRAAATSMHFALAISSVMMIAALIFPNHILGIFTDKPAVIAEAAKYLRIVCISYVFFGATQAILGVLRSVECAFIGFVTSCFALVFNLIFNYVLIFGKFGFPELGIEGAAIATLIARIAELVVVVIYVAFFDKKLSLKLRDFIFPEKEITKKFMKVSTPVVLSGASWGVAMGLQTAILGRLTEEVISSSSISSTVFQIMSVFIYGAATAASVMIGKTMGEASSGGFSADDVRREIKHRANVMQVMFLCLGAVTGLMIFLSRDFIISLYNISPDTVVLARQFMTVLSVTVVGTAYQMSCLTGIVRGGGDTKFVFINDLIFMWGIVLPTSYIAAFVLELSPVMIFICLKSDQIIKCIVAVIKVNFCNWMKKI